MNYCIICKTKPASAGKYCGGCKHKKTQKKCPDCGKVITDIAIYCGKCNQKYRPPGTGHKIHVAKIKNRTYSPIGTETIDKRGFVFVKVSHGNSHRSKDGLYGNYKAKHRIVAEETLGRKLHKDETVHHIDGNRENNLSSNLLVLTSKDHNKLNHFLSLLNQSTADKRKGLIETIISRYPEHFN